MDQVQIDVEQVGFAVMSGMDHVAVPDLVGQCLWCIAHDHQVTGIDVSAGWSLCGLRNRSGLLRAAAFAILYYEHRNAWMVKRSAPANVTFVMDRAQSPGRPTQLLGSCDADRLTPLRS